MTVVIPTGKLLSGSILASKGKSYMISLPHAYKIKDPLHWDPHLGG